MPKKQKESWTFCGADGFGFATAYAADVEKLVQAKPHIFLGAGTYRRGGSKKMDLVCVTFVTSSGHIVNPSNLPSGFKEKLVCQFIGDLKLELEKFMTPRAFRAITKKSKRN